MKPQKHQHVIVISILVLFLPCGGGSGCSVHQHPNGTVTFNLDETVPVSEHDSWQINNVVQADEMSFNTTTIEIRGLRSVNFKKCFKNVTYWSADPGKSISCLYNCSTTVTPIQEPHLSDILVGVTVATILSAVALLCILTVCGYWKRKELQIWLQNRCESRCDYKQAEQDHVVSTVELESNSIC